MIDLKLYRENPEIFIKGAKDKGTNIDFDLFTKLEEEVRTLKGQNEELLAKRNALTKEVQMGQKSGQDVSDKISQVKELKVDIEKVAGELATKEQQFNDLYLQIPNPCQDDVPFGKDDSENEVMEYVGDKPEFDFKPLPHWELLEQRDMLDQERSAKVSGSRFYYIRDGVVRLELALINWLVDKLAKKGFRPTIGPNMVRKDAMYATGFFPADENEIYRVNPDDDDLYLIGTSEVSMVAQHANETLKEDQLPIRYCSFSPCYRREAGTYGKDSKGMIRVHQFEKVEMVSFVKPEDSVKEHELLLSIEEEIYKELGIPYQKLLICSGDLGAPAAKKYDLEAWFPGQDCYKEITSTSNCTDFQSRRGKIKYKGADSKGLVHTLNGTAASMRALVAIIENNQTADMKIKVPQVLKKYIDDEYI